MFKWSGKKNQKENNTLWLVKIIRNENNTITVLSDNKLKAVTNGQIACFYDSNDALFAAGIIDSIYNEGKKVELN